MPGHGYLIFCLSHCCLRAVNGAHDQRHHRAFAGCRRPVFPVAVAKLQERLFRFQEHYERIAAPFEWKFTRADLDALLERFQSDETPDPLRRAA